MLLVVHFERRKSMKRIYWVTAVAIFCLSVVGCGAGLKETFVLDSESRDMDWFHKNNGYVVTTITDLSNQPVMEFTVVPLNSEALLAVANKDIANEVNFCVKQWIGRQHPVCYLTVYAYRDCCFCWTVVRLQQGSIIVQPQKVFPGNSLLVTAAAELMEKYGVRRFKEVNRKYTTPFANPYTGKDLLELGKETELVQGESLTAIIAFSNGIQLNQPFRFISEEKRYVLSNGEIYTTREISKLIRNYLPPGQEMPGQNIHRYGVKEEPRGRGRLRQIAQRSEQSDDDEALP